MFSYGLLPISLVALLLVSPLLAAPPTTFHDPFHDIAIHAPKPPEQPICCLRPLTPLEPTEEEVLLTFEEWKAKRLADLNKELPPGSQPTVTPGQKPVGSIVSDNGSEPNSGSISSEGRSPPSPPEVTLAEIPPDRLSPHFRIPITDRFNYASTDCSARVHSAHKSAKSASSILTSKKDRYMLSPCAEPNQFVVVELCEDIWIDTVQLANYEFFSGVFKDFSVSVAKTYTTDPKRWVPAGTYRAKNVRGVQSFHPPTSLGDFYRFIRIDFHSHYGNEYYCPVSLLRVYGLTHLEQWKWDMWEDESRRRVEEAVSAPGEVVEEPSKSVHMSATGSMEDIPGKMTESIIVSAEPSATPQQPFSTPADTTASTPLTSSPTIPESTPHIPASSAGSASMIPSDSSYTSRRSKKTKVSTTSSAVSTIATPVPDSAAHLVGEAPAETPLKTKKERHRTVSVPVSQDTVSSSVSSATTSSTISSSMSSSSFNVSATTLESSSSVSSSSAPSSVLSNSSSIHSSRSITTPIPVNTPQSLTVVAPPITTGGESIYRTIMNRLSALDTNTTLYARYVEEQIAGVREVLRRVGEDVGRLEGIGKAQAQMYQRSLSDFERQRRRMELEHNELLSKVNYLTAEVTLEKRLGIAQLCLLLTVLVFMTLTRGSRGEVVHAAPRARTSSMREWGKRTLSFSGDWMTKFRSPKRPSEATHLDAVAQANLDKTPGQVAFPSESAQVIEIARNRRPQLASSCKTTSTSRPRTPSLRTPMSRHNTYNHNRPPSPTSSRPVLQRANSGGPIVLTTSTSVGVIGPVPKSAKRWARSAHLHEVKHFSAHRRMNINTGTTPRADRDTENKPPFLPSFTSDSHLLSIRRERGLQNGEGDVFGPSFDGPSGSSVGQAGSSRSGRGRLSSQKQLSVGDMRLGCVRKGTSSENSEMDSWVDTDADGTDSETGDHAAQSTDGIPVQSDVP
ncbi:unnamed protein product [Somion occarium]|uniref:SUN domain-containing protein n=1 Tax=Somion occarium TaxID=3059160 RepID=A0ABP1E2Q7_9APHY